MDKLVYFLLEHIDVAASINMIAAKGRCNILGHEDLEATYVKCKRLLDEEIFSNDKIFVEATHREVIYRFVHDRLETAADEIEKIKAQCGGKE